MPSVLSPRSFSQDFDVLAYGAIGDGTTNDAAAIQAALDAAATYATTNKGARVVFPPGQYKVSSTLICKSGTTISAYGAYIFAGNNNYMLSTYISQGSGYDGGFSNIKIMGGIWDAKGQSAPAGTKYNLFTLASGRNVHFTDVTMRNVPSYHAIDINGMDGVSVTNCRFEGFDNNDNDGGATDDFREAIQIQECTVDNTPCINIRVTNNYMGPAVDGSGLGSHGKFFGSHSSVSGVIHRSIVCSNNTIEGALTVAIGGQSWSDVTVSGNVIHSAGSHAIHFYPPISAISKGIVVTGNTVLGFAGNGIHFESGGSTDTFSDCVISNNSVESASTSLSGIKVNYFNDGAVTGNTVRNVDQHGIYFDLVTTDTTVTGNSIEGVGLSGIQLKGSLRCTVTGNRFYNIQNHGVFISDAAQQNLIASNNIIGVSRATNATYSGVNINDDSNHENSIIGNKFQKFGSGNEALTPISIASATPAQTTALANAFGDDWSTNYLSNFTLNGATLHNSNKSESILLHRTTTQSHTSSGNNQAVAWSSAIKNTGPSSWWASGSPNNIVMPWAGLYRFDVFVGWASNATGARAAHLNETTTLSDANVKAGISPGGAGNTESGRMCTFTTIVNCTAGTTYVVTAYQASGGSLNIDVPVGTFTGMPMAACAVTYLGNT